MYGPLLCEDLGLRLISLWRAVVAIFFYTSTRIFSAAHQCCLLDALQGLRELCGRRQSGQRRLYGCVATYETALPALLFCCSALVRSELPPCVALIHARPRASIEVILRASPVLHMPSVIE